MYEHRFKSPATQVTHQCRCACTHIWSENLDPARFLLCSGVFKAEGHPLLISVPALHLPPFKSYDLVLRGVYIGRLNIGPTWILWSFVQIGKLAQNKYPQLCCSGPTKAVQQAKGRGREQWLVSPLLSALIRLVITVKAKWKQSDHKVEEIMFTECRAQPWVHPNPHPASATIEHLKSILVNTTMIWLYYTS